MKTGGKKRARRREEEGNKDYEWFLYNITFGSVECVYDIGVVWPFEDG